MYFTKLTNSYFTLVACKYEGKNYPTGHLSKLKLQKVTVQTRTLMGILSNMLLMRNDTKNVMWKYCRWCM